MHIFVANLLKCNHLIIAAFKSIPYLKKVPDTLHVRLPRFDPVFIVTNTHAACKKKLLVSMVHPLPSSETQGQLVGSIKCSW